MSAKPAKNGACSAASALIVKVGGSLIETDRLEAILDLIAAATRPVIVVPGGGPFADSVRRAQKCYGFSDAVAHDMALLSMDQTAVLALSMQPRLQAVDTLAGFDRVLALGRIPIWRPYRLASQDRQIPRDWTITSDGLAARLSQRLHATRLILLKSRRVDSSKNADDLAACGVVDAEFARIVVQAHIDWRVIGPGEERVLVDLIGAPPPKPEKPPKKPC